MNKNKFFSNYFSQEIKNLEKDIADLGSYLGEVPVEILSKVQMQLDQLLTEFTGAMVQGEAGHRVSEKWEEYRRTLPPEPEAVVTTRKEDRNQFLIK